MKDKLASLSFIAAPLCSAVVLDADRDIEGLEARFGDGNAVHIRLSGTADLPWSTKMDLLAPQVLDSRLAFAGKVVMNLMPGFWRRWVTFLTRLSSQDPSS